MNISYNWLKDLVEIDSSPEDLAKKLTGAGLAVEGIHEFGDDFVFDIDLTWAVEGDTSADVPSIFTAAQEQLGLRLNPARAPVEVLVIERADPPTPD